MKLSKKQMLLVSFMLFSLFFGAGNLIFPPFLGQNAGTNWPLAISTFLITAVALPVMGVIAVAEFDGLDKLASKVHPLFAGVFTVLIYLSIGPGLGIPRATSVPFEMAVAPYLPKESSLKLFMLLYSAVFFITATWLALTPSKLVQRIGKFLTPSLLCLIVFLFISFLLKGHTAVAAPTGEYIKSAAVFGFLEGYNTMDAIAALNFGLVIATTIKSLGISDKKQVMSYTVKAGLAAGSILSLIYLVISYLGMATSGLYPIQDNGAWVLRCIVYDLFKETGAILLAAIFTLACLTTCVGLITSISQYFSGFLKRVSYRQLVFFISTFSFLVCNLGLNTILSISVPVLNMIYPVAIVLIVLGILNKYINDNPYIFPFVTRATAFVSIIYSLEKMHINVPLLSQSLHYLPFYKLGMGWVVVALVMAACAIVYHKLTKTQQ